MKKAEIKRRKRVVPAHMAGEDQSSVYTAESMEEDSSSTNPAASPYQDASHPYQPNNHEQQPTHNGEPSSAPRPAGGPIPVDFTDWHRSRQGPSDTDTNPRKRSFSTTLDEPQQSEHYPHAQNIASPPKDHNLDPSLPGPSEPEATQQLAQKDARRSQLRAEAEKMRFMLLEKERELAELGEQGG